MKLLISGATGFIGKHLCKRLQAEGHDLQAIIRPSSNCEFLEAEKIPAVVFDNDLERLIAFLQEEQFNGVIHLASLFLAAHKPTDIQGLIESNVLFSTSLLEAAVASQIPWFINTGTFWQHYQSRPYSPVNLYAATKQAFEDIAQYYLETSPINFVTLKLSDTFGPQDTRPKIFTLWSRISQSGESLDMSPGEQLIDISYIDNVIDGYLRLITLLSQKDAAKLRGQCFGLASPERMSLKQLAATFEKVTGKKLAINWGKRPYRPREVMVPWENPPTIPGWKAKVSLEEGIKKTINES